jgi:hypothetical protein
MIDHSVSYGAHAERYAIIGSDTQAKTSDIRDCDYRIPARNRGMAGIKSTQPEAVEVFDRLSALSLTQRELAAALDIAENKVSKVRAGERQLTAGEYRAATAWLDEVERRGGFVETADQPESDPGRDYLPVEILPSFAGMGGGGHAVCVRARALGGGA